MPVFCNKDWVKHSCGLEVIGDFDDEMDEWEDREIPLRDLQFGNTGFFVAGFIEGDKMCTRVYRYLKKKYKTVYQSPVRRNENSGNMFYFVIYDSKE